MNKKTVGLFGTCNNSIWRDTLIPLFNDSIDAFNPVVKDWTEECYKRELLARKNSDFILYTITPRMTGVYAIAELVEDSLLRPERILFCVLEEDSGFTFTEAQLKSLVAVKKMVIKNGVKVFDSLKSIATFLNGYTKQERSKLELSVSEARNILDEDASSYVIISNEIVGKSRWCDIYEVIIQRKSDGKFFKDNYRQGSTENQEERPWEYDIPNFTEVFLVNKLVQSYE